MFRKIMRLVTAAILLLAVALAPTLGAGPAQPRCKSVNGHVVSELVTGPDCASPLGLCTRGRFIGGIKGEFFFTATSLTPHQDTPATGVFHYTGDITIKTKDGDIFLKDAGAFDAVPGSTGDVGSVATVTGGTGKYAGASGRIRINGTFTPEEGGDSEYRGTICTQ